jgi:outer membrane lipoprotein SlyB
MNPFYDLNKKLNSIGNEQEQIAKAVAKAVEKTPARKTLEESLRSDLSSLMEDGTGGMNFSGSGSLEEKTETKYGVCIVGHNGGKPVKTFDTEAEAKAYADKGIRVDGKLLQGSVRTMVGETDYSAKKAAAGKDIGKPGKNFSKIAKGAAERYGSKEAGERVAGAVLNKLRHANEDMTDEGNEFSGALANAKKDHKSEFTVGGKTFPVQESHCPACDCSPCECDSVEESALQAYLGNKKYGKQGMDALRKAGREHAGKDKMNQIRNRYDKMDEAEMECDTPTPSKGIPGNVPVKGKMDRLKGKRDYYENNEADDSDEDIMDYLNRKLAPHDKEQAKENAVSKPYNGSAGDADAYNGMEFEGTAFTDQLRKTPKGGKFKMGNKEYTDTSDLDETMTRQHFQHTADLLKHIEDPAKRMELAKHHAGVFKASNPRFDHGKFMKACNCDEGIAGQAAGTIAGGALGGPVGAAIGGAIGNNLTNEEDFEEGLFGGGMMGGVMSMNNPLNNSADIEEGYAEMDAWLKQREKEKGTGKFDKRKVSTGTVYTRRFADEPEDDTDAPISKGGNPAVKRGRGRPAGTKGATGSRGPTGKSKLMSKDAIGEENVDEVCHHCGQAIQEKAVSKKQQRFMGMVHAAQKGEKPASKEVAKTAKGMKKTDAEDFASTKHKGLPEKVKSKKTEEGKGDGNLANNAKPYDKVTRGDVVAGRLGKDEEGGKKKFKKEEKVEETTTSGSVATTSDAPKSSKGGMKFGGGIYDSWNRTIENMISENVNVNTTTSKNDDGQDHESITISVDGDDVSRFKQLLQSMGIAQNHSHSDSTHSAEPCGTCGGVPCQCDELADEGIIGQAAGTIAGTALGGPVGGAIGGAIGNNLTNETDVTVSQNEPDYPTNQEESDDVLQYSGGLNRKKSTGQTTIPVVASQEDRLHSMEESVDSFLNLYKAFKTK